MTADTTDTTADPGRTVLENGDGTRTIVLASGERYLSDASGVHPLSKIDRMPARQIEAVPDSSDRFARLSDLPAHRLPLQASPPETLQPVIEAWLQAHDVADRAALEVDELQARRRGAVARDLADTTTALAAGKKVPPATSLEDAARIEQAERVADASYNLAQQSSADLVTAARACWPEWRASLVTYFEDARAGALLALQQLEALAAERDAALQAVVVVDQSLGLNWLRQHPEHNRPVEDPERPNLAGLTPAVLLESSRNEVSWDPARRRSGLEDTRQSLTRAPRSFDWQPGITVQQPDSAA